MEHRFRNGSGVNGMQLLGNGWHAAYNEYDEVGEGLGLVNEVDMAKMTESEKQAYVEMMRELIAKRLQVYRRAAIYLKQVRNPYLKKLD